MQKRILTLVLALILAVAFAGLAQAEEVTTDGLLRLLSGQGPDEALTRGGFAIMLNAAAALTPATDEAAVAAALVKEGVLRGYPDGSLGLGAPVTRAQAAVFVVRTLGLPEAVDPGTVTGLTGFEEHWAYRPMAWMVREGLMAAGAPNARLTVGEGALLLAHVFGPVAEGRELNARSEAAQKDVRTMRMQGTFDMEMKMRATPDVELPPGLDDVHLRGTQVAEISLDQGMYQLVTIEASVAGETMNMVTESYLTEEGFFIRMADPLTGAAAWQRMPDGLFPDIATMMAQSMGQVLPPEMDKVFYYRYLGEEQLDGRTVFKLASYAHIRDVEAMLAMLSDYLGSGTGLGALMAMAGQMFESMHIVGVTCLDQETLAPVKADMLIALNFAPEIMGMPNPIAGMVMQQRTSFEADVEVVIELPAEARNAPELPLPELKI